MRKILIILIASIGFNAVGQNKIKGGHPEGFFRNYETTDSKKYILVCMKKYYAYSLVSRADSSNKYLHLAYKKDSILTKRFLQTLE